ncbi:MAG: hypothetical protein ACH350_02130 [Parachlamydiaceae bacterium]
MKNIALTFLAALSLIQLEGVLPPLYQTSKEMIAILSDEQLGKTLQSGEVIEKMEKNDHGYAIITNKSHLQVSILYEEAKQPGPATFKIDFGNRIPFDIES